MTKINRDGAKDVIAGLRKVAEDTAYFEVGDIVGLRSYGAKATVIGTDGETVEIAYFDVHNVLHTNTLPVDALKLLSAMEAYE